MALLKGWKGERLALTDGAGLVERDFPAPGPAR